MNIEKNTDTYIDNDRLTIKNLCEMIHFPKETAEAICFPLSSEEYKRYRKLFDHDRQAFYRSVKEKEQYRLLFLRLYLGFACDAYVQYRELGISDEIFTDTFTDIRLWAENCMRDFGEMGIEEYDWFWRHITLHLFRIGRLEYEVVCGSEESKCNLRKLAEGDIVLNLHIPQGEPLLYPACIESLKKAAQFFKTLPVREITCHSWLLSPVFSEILPEESNIRRFQKLFDVYEKDGQSREAEERIFHVLKDDPKEYPQDTSLRKALRQYLIEGGHPGSAFGMVKEEI